VQLKQWQCTAALGVSLSAGPSPVTLLTIAAEATLGSSQQQPKLCNVPTIRKATAQNTATRRRNSGRPELMRRNRICDIVTLEPNGSEMQ
jgi:hypothetical protein